MAERRPAIGVTSEATAIPKASGNATNETLIAAKTSNRQFSVKPLSPVAGMLLFVFINTNYFFGKLVLLIFCDDTIDWLKNKFFYHLFFD
jgi:hypothetical protein